RKYFYSLVSRTIYNRVSYRYEKIKSGVLKVLSFFNDWSSTFSSFALNNITINSTNILVNLKLLYQNIDDLAVIPKLSRYQEIAERLFLQGRINNTSKIVKAILYKSN